MIQAGSKVSSGTGRVAGASAMVILSPPIIFQDASQTVRPFTCTCRPAINSLDGMAAGIGVAVAQGRGRAAWDRQHGWPGSVLSRE